MPKFEVNWCKTYYASGTVMIDAMNESEARSIVEEHIGDYTGILHYEPEQDYIYVWENDYPIV